MTERLNTSFNKAAQGRLILFRHGETDYNARKLMTGQRNIPLNADGRDDARAAGAALQGIFIDAAYSSTLDRSFETATIALDVSGNGDVAVTRDKRIMESNTGDFTGRNYKADPEILAFKSNNLAYAVPLPNGESDKDVTKRVAEFFYGEILPRMQRGETVLVSAHAGVLIAFDIVLGQAPEPKDDEKPLRKSIPAASPVAFDFENGVLKQVAPLQPPPAIASKGLHP